MAVGAEAYKMRIKKKDTVLVLAGKDRGKKGEVIRVLADSGSLLVSGVNRVTKHARPTQSDPGGIQKKEAPFSASRVMLVCPKCERAMRPKLDRLATGERIRICRKCGEAIL